MKQKSTHPQRTRLKDVAERAGVSATTVSLVLKNPDSNRVSKSTAEKILRAAKELNYIPNLSARTLVTKKSNTIGMVLSSLQNPHYSELAHYIVKKAQEQNYSTILNNAANSLDGEQKALNDLVNRGCDGVIICSVMLDDPVVEEFASYQIPFITMIRTLGEAPSKPHVDSVSVDNSRGAYLAVEHLIKLGHSRIALFAGNLKTSTGYNRLQGSLSAISTYGIEHDDSLIFHGGNFLRTTGYKLTEELLKIKPRPTAIFAHSDYMALGVLECLANKGLKVPEDMAVVGFDNTMVSGIPGIDLTTISQPIEDMADLGLDLLFSKIQDKNKRDTKRILLDPVLVKRKTCGHLIQNK